MTCDLCDKEATFTISQRAELRTAADDERWIPIGHRCDDHVHHSVVRYCR